MDGLPRKAYAHLVNKLTPKRREWAARFIAMGMRRDWAVFWAGRTDIHHFARSMELVEQELFEEDQSKRGYRANVWCTYECHCITPEDIDRMTRD